MADAGILRPHRYWWRDGVLLRWRLQIFEGSAEEEGYFTSSEEASCACTASRREWERQQRTIDAHIGAVVYAAAAL